MIAQALIYHKTCKIHIQGVKIKLVGCDSPAPSKFMKMVQNGLQQDYFLDIMKMAKKAHIWILTNLDGCKHKKYHHFCHEKSFRPSPKQYLDFLKNFHFGPIKPCFWICFMKSPLNSQNGSQNQLRMLETFKIMIFDQIQSKISTKS